LVPNYSITKLPIYPILPTRPGKLADLRSFYFQRAIYGELTLRRFRSIAILFAHINGERGHVLDSPLCGKYAFTRA
jgi:hypothetical protein